MKNDPSYSQQEQKISICHKLFGETNPYPDQETTIKPHLFYIEPVNDEVARLKPITMPVHWELQAIRNDNPALKFHIDELKVHPWFNPALFKNKGDKLYVNNPNYIGEGKKIALKETLCKSHHHIFLTSQQSLRCAISSLHHHFFLSLSPGFIFL